MGADLDAIDLKILHELQHDAEIPNNELADRVGLSPSPCLRRVRILKEAGVIRGSVALLDAGAVGLNLNAFVRITLHPQTQDISHRFETEVRDLPQVIECFAMAGDEDYLLRVIVPDLSDFERFVKTHLTCLTGVSQIRSSFALGQVSYTTALPLMHLS